MDTGLDTPLTNWWKFVCPTLGVWVGPVSQFDQMGGVSFYVFDDIIYIKTLLSRVYISRSLKSVWSLRYCTFFNLSDVLLGLFSKPTFFLITSPMPVWIICHAHLGTFHPSKDPTGRVSIQDGSNSATLCAIYICLPMLGVYSIRVSSSYSAISGRSVSIWPLQLWRSWKRKCLMKQTQ